MVYIGKKLIKNKFLFLIDCEDMKFLIEKYIIDIRKFVFKKHINKSKTIILEQGSKPSKILFHTAQKNL